MPPAPSADALALRAELAASIRDTLLAEARKNESAIAVVRVLTLVGLVGVELWLLSGPTLLGDRVYAAAGLTAGYLVGSVGLLAWLHRGGFSSTLAFVLPVSDTAVAAGRLAFVFALGLPHVVSTQELATVEGLACLLAVTGAFRLQPRAVWWSTTLGGLLYAGFAAWMGVAPFQRCVHLVLIAACGFAGAQFTRILSRAVHQEVTRMTLRRLLPATVVDAADADPLALLTEPRSLEATVMVTDLRGFTTWAERRSPLEVLAVLNEVQGMLAAAVTAEGGMVDKFMGDGMLAVFGAPTASTDHADRALSAVRRMREGMARFPELAVGIGVHSGEIVVGCLGSGIRMEFTILGDTVNTASRLESATKEHGVPVLVSDTTRLRATAPLRELFEIELRGRAEKIRVWTVP